MELRRAWTELEERTRRQLPVSQSVVKGLLRGEVGVIDHIDAIDVEVVETKMLTAADEIYKQWKGARGCDRHGPQRNYQRCRKINYGRSLMNCNR